MRSYQEWERFDLKKNLLYTIVLLAVSAWFVVTHFNWGTGTSLAPAITLQFPADRFPETAKHIKEAIGKGEPSTCTIDREEADEHRKQSLKGVPTKKGYDRDEWPMAMCSEGGAGADIMYIDPSDNRGAGSWVSHQLEDYPDGTKVLFVVK